MYSALCNGNVPISPLLFGDDLVIALKEARQVGNIGRNFRSKKGKRFWNRPKKEFGWKDRTNEDSRVQKIMKI